MGIWEVLGLAALGGAILNAMPCVFAVIPIKILSWIKTAEGSLRKQAALSGAYCAGLVASFAVLGIICASALATGTYLGFGFQMYNPWFCGAMGLLMGYFGLKLTGLLPKTAQYFLGLVKKPASTSLLAPKITGILSAPLLKLKNWGSDLSSRIRTSSPLWGAFSQGCLTTLLGSACTGPFLGYAMGASVIMGPWVTLMAFVACGAGMALPYAILGLCPNLLKKLPKSGSWMKIIETVCGSLMLLTGIWFLWLAIF